jgi:indole-3-glycerol phosphate synthase
MPDFLQQMAEASAKRMADARRATPEKEMRRAAEHMPPARALRFGDELDVIAEVKRAAPSTGVLSESVSVADRVRRYEQAGAAAISILTEPTRFRGGLADLRKAAGATGLPVMRKDFLVDPYQVYEARANGADGVLLIAAILDDNTLKESLSVAAYLGMFALVETFDALDVERAQLAGAELVGVNCRNLRDLSVEFGRFEDLRVLIDPDRIAVAESGISTPAQLSRVRELGYNAALIGRALMREDDPLPAMRELLGSLEASR